MSTASPEEGDGRPSLEDRLRVLAGSRHLIYARLGAYMDLPVEGRRQQLEQVSQGHASLFASLIDEIATEGDDFDDQVRITVGLILADDRERVDVFNALAGKEVCAPIRRSHAEVVERVKQHLSENPEGEDSSLADISKALFITGLRSDVECIVNHAERLPVAKAVRVGRIFGKHSIDIAKLGVGLAIGITLADKLRRKA